MKGSKDWEAEWLKIAAESRKLAKRANQRLVRLERAAKMPGMKSILSYAYKTAMKDIKTTGKTGKQRFIENPKLIDVFDEAGKKLTGQEMYKKNVQRLRQRTKNIEEFLSAESSTIGQSRSGKKTIGIKAVWSKSTNTINEKYLSSYDLSMSDNDMKRFFDSKKQAKLEKEVGSGRMFVVASVMKKYNLKSNKRELEKFMKENIDLKKYDLDPSDIKAKTGESYKDYLDRLSDYISYTGDEVLDDLVNKALKAGINANNIFI